MKEYLDGEYLIFNIIRDIVIKVASKRAVSDFRSLLSIMTIQRMVLNVKYSPIRYSFMEPKSTHANQGS